MGDWELATRGRLLLVVVAGTLLGCTLGTEELVLDFDTAARARDRFLQHKSSEAHRLAVAELEKEVALLVGQLFVLAEASIYFQDHLKTQMGVNQRHQSSLALHEVQGRPNYQSYVKCTMFI
jgi:hypothetical protein